MSRSNFVKELVQAMPDGVTAEPTLKEKKNVWEEQKDPFMAWIIPDRGRWACFIRPRRHLGLTRWRRRKREANGTAALTSLP